MDRKNYIEQRRQADQAMIDNLETRCGRKDRTQVEEEELDEHPLLAGTSCMHYLSSPSGPTDLPDVSRKLLEWSEALGGQQARMTEPGRSLFMFDQHKYLYSMGFYEYVWKGREAFAYQVISTAPNDVVGYWFRPGMAIALEGMMSLCSSTKGGLLLNEEGVRANFTFR